MYIQFTTTVFVRVKYNMEDTPLKRSNKIFLHRQQVINLPKFWKIYKEFFQSLSTQPHFEK